ncbi:MAG TPA: DUF6094 domain-containing protein [Ktedonobacterales bacterium]|jgi:hypothetical protein|nr:DUF6094 domain-containing protein [Ktedonobacterales bacterium]
MSRLEAVAAGLYYPTPEPVVSAIGRLLCIADPSPVRAPTLTGQAPVVRLLDPCAGKGRALALLAASLQRQDSEQVAAGQHTPALACYGIEPNLERAQEAQTRIPNLLVSSFFTTTLSEGSFQLAFVNPPYDDVSATDNAPQGVGAAHRRERLELRFLRRVTSKLAPDGVLIWIVPQRLLAVDAAYLAAQYRDLTCWRFPDTPWRAPDAPPDSAATPMYTDFGQVALLALRRRMPIPVDAHLVARIEAWAAQGADLEPLPEASSASGTFPIGRYAVPVTTTPLRYFLAATFDPDALAAQLTCAGQGVWGERGYVERHWPDLDSGDLGIGRPLAPLRRGHLALLAAAGIANGQELRGAQGQRLVVKGSCRKVSVREESEERDPTTGEQVRVTTETERFEVSLWAIDLDSGAVIHVV